MSRPGEALSCAERALRVDKRRKDWGLGGKISEQLFTSATVNSARQFEKVIVSDMCGAIFPLNPKKFNNKFTQLTVNSQVEASPGH